MHLRKNNVCLKLCKDLSWKLVNLIEDTVPLLLCEEPVTLVLKWELQFQLQIGNIDPMKPLVRSSIHDTSDFIDL